MNPRFIFVIVFLALGCVEAPPSSSFIENDMGSDLPNNAQEDLNNTQPNNATNLTPCECSGGQFCSESGCVDCLDDSQCGAEVCVSGSCVECREEGDCGIGRVCSDQNVCVRCVSNEDCALGRVCTADNECVRCIANSDCGGGMECTSDNRCVGCVDDTTCRGGRCNEANECVDCLGDSIDACLEATPHCDRQTCVVCTENAGCEGNGRCNVDDDDPNNNTCVMCIEDADCRPNRCNPDTNLCVECLDSEDCGDGGVCDLEIYSCVPCLVDIDCDNAVCLTGSASSENACVECRDATQCAGNDKVCHPTINQCVDCNSSADCDGAFCKIDSIAPTQNTCVECLTNAECVAPSESRCDSNTNECAICSTVQDCGHLGNNFRHCSPNAGCIECLPHREANDCPANQRCFGTDCSGGQVGTSVALQPCTTSATCAQNHRCVPVNYDGTGHGNFCMRIAPALCPRPTPFTLTRTDSEGNTHDFCFHNEMLTTPGAIAEHAKPCATNANCNATASTCSLHPLLICSYPCNQNTECPANSQCSSNRCN